LLQQTTEPPLRQDDARVQAIRVSEEDEKEARLLFARSPHCLPEHVFVAQLHAQAAALDETFRESLLRLLLPHTSQPPVWHSKDEVTLRCCFSQEEDDVTVRFARIKSERRMSEKLKKFAPSPRDTPAPAPAPAPHTAPASRLPSAAATSRPQAAWPLAANILDPVRLSVVCRGPRKMTQILEWLQEAKEEEELTVCRIKNSFMDMGEKMEEEEEEVGVVTASMLLRGPLGMNIIGEVQLHDERLFPSFVQRRRMFRIRRAKTMENYRMENPADEEKTDAQTET